MHELGIICTGSYIIVNHHQFNHGRFPLNISHNSKTTAQLIYSLTTSLNYLPTFTIQFILDLTKSLT